ncbi:F-box only protein 9 [Nilaparvata lugens]|uniref:F-box only protein 9 n=1 Tax=Nilaparvata lugens TaxID=108931 RepID=UPI00193EBD22|nr:F-box only protein 9 [Nilaparvata lugens]
MSNVPSASGCESGNNGNGGGGSGVAGESLDGEDQEDSSSSSSSFDHNSEKKESDELANFRAQWQRELKSVSPARKTTKENDSNFEDVTVEEKAKYLFVKGAEYEQAGKLYEAIHFYKKAVQMVPDIEFRLYEETSKQARQTHDVEVISEHNLRTDDEYINEDSEDDCDNRISLLARLQRIVNRTHCVCQPKDQQKSTHISELPMEIILYILRWVVSSELDLRSLEMCSRVCRGFYVCSRDQEIWRLACLRIWGLHCGESSTFGSWREMYIGRPRLHFNGCYISKTTYIRQGENSFQDQFYRPCHIVEYYRYLRFFPDGKVMMLTTPDDPYSGGVSRLGSRVPRHQEATLVGHYRLTDQRVAVALQRQDAAATASASASTPVNTNRRSRRPAPNNLHNQTFHLELQIASYRSQVHNQLIWTGYSVLTRNWAGQETNTSFELVPNRFPPFWFSRVKSYNAKSESPLS